MPALSAALSDPWSALEAILDGPLHPGGYESTERLLDRAEVGPETVLLDVGCGAGGAVTLALERGARAVGLDRSPSGTGVVRGEMERLPFGDGTVDVVVAECSLCLAADTDTALAEVKRVLGPYGRLALSDVVVEEAVPELPPALAKPLCLDGRRSREWLREQVEEAGLRVDSVVDHHDALLAMRDEFTRKVDYETLLSLSDDRGTALRDGIQTVERAVEDGRIGYVSMVGRVD